MNWLIDAQLPPRLCAWFRTKGESCMHIADLPSGLKLMDDVLWKYAAERNLVVVSKDRDFFQRSLVYGMPPQVVFIQVGNCSNDHLIEILSRFWDDIAASIRNNRPLVMVTRTDVKKY